MLSGWWDEIDDEIMTCLGDAATLTPSEIGTRVGLSSDAVTSVLCMLAQQGKVRICLVAANQPSDAGLMSPSDAVVVKPAA